MTITKALVIAVMCAMTTAAYAGSTSTTEKQNVEISKPAKSDPLEACAGMLEKPDWGFVATFPNGAKFEVVQHPSGMPHSFTYRSVDGSEETAHVGDYIAEAEAEAKKTADPAMRSAAYIKLQHQVAQSFKKFLGANCKRLLVNPEQHDRKLPDDDASSKAGFDNPFLPDYRNWEEMDRRAFMREADFMVNDLFAGGMFDFVENLKERVPECRTVVTDCQTTCDRMGAYGGGVGCASLGAVASAVLTAPVGIAVGAYCAGKVFVKVEECRGGCNLPVVKCTW